MKTLIHGGRVLCPASGLDQVADVALADGQVLAVGQVPSGFTPDQQLNASGAWVLPGLIDLCARLREPGQEHEGMLESELAAAVCGGVTRLVCPPDTDPVLDEPGLVDMLRFRAAQLRLAHVHPQGALTRGLQGQALTEMAELSESGCVGFGQAEHALRDTLVLQRAMQYAATYGFTVWLRAQDAWLGGGVAASGPLATRMGLSGVPVVAEVIALHTITELMRVTGARVHVCRLSSAAGVELVRQAKAQGLPLTCDISVHNLHLCDHDLGYFDSRAHLQPPLRQASDREALANALADGTVDALVSDHNPLDANAKHLPFAESEPGATAIELLLPLAVKWAQAHNVPLTHALARVTTGPAAVLGGTLPALAGSLQPGAPAHVCVCRPSQQATVVGAHLRSQGKFTPFEGAALPVQVVATWVDGHLAFDDTQH
ncbi:MAG: dihydroorotase [Burkholderiaceae bacterium]